MNLTRNAQLGSDPHGAYARVAQAWFASAPQVRPTPSPTEVPQLEALHRSVGRRGAGCRARVWVLIHARGLWPHHVHLFFFVMMGGLFLLGCWVLMILFCF